MSIKCPFGRYQARLWWTCQTVCPPPHLPPLPIRTMTVQSTVKHISPFVLISYDQQCAAPCSLSHQKLPACAPARRFERKSDARRKTKLVCPKWFPFYLCARWERPQMLNFIISSPMLSWWVVHTFPEQRSTEKSCHECFAWIIA